MLTLPDPVVGSRTCGRRTVWTVRLNVLRPERLGAAAPVLVYLVVVALAAAGVILGERLAGWWYVLTVPLLLQVWTLA